MLYSLGSSKYHRVAGVLFSSLVTSAVCAVVSNPFDVVYTHIAASPSPLGVLEAYSQIGLTGTDTIGHGLSCERVSCVCVLTRATAGLFAGVGYRVASTTLNNFFIWYVTHTHTHTVSALGFHSLSLLCVCRVYYDLFKELIAL
jgi:hypothetical protein